MTTIQRRMLPTIDLLEGLALLGQVSRIGFTGTLNVGKPKISEAQYINIIKEAVFN